MRALFRDLLTHRELLWILVQRNLKIRYKNSVLGFFWTLLGPIFLILIYWAFIRLLKIPIRIDALITGIVVWQFIATSMGDSLNAVLGNANLVTKTAFPRWLLPLSTVCANFVNYLLTFLVLLVFLLVRQAHFGPVYLLPLILLTHFALCLGLSFFVSSLNVFFRDVEHLMSVILLAWFFLSPVMYTNEYVSQMIHEQEGISCSIANLLQACYLINPMAGIVTSYRSALLSEDLLPLAMFVAPFLLSWAMLLTGLAVFQKLEKRFGDEL